METAPGQVNAARTLLRKVDDQFVAVQAAIAERKTVAVDQMLEEIDQTLDAAADKFRQRKAADAEILIFDAKRAVRRLAGLQDRAEQDGIREQMEALRQQMTEALAAIEDIIVRNQALADRALRRTHRKPQEPADNFSEELRLARSKRPLAAFWTVMAIIGAAMILTIAWEAMR